MEGENVRKDKERRERGTYLRDREGGVGGSEGHLEI